LIISFATLAKPVINGSPMFLASHPTIKS